MRRRPTFEWLEHTADIRVRIRGKDEADLYASAALTCTAILVEWPEPDADALPAALGVSGESPEDRLVELLRELLFRFDVAGELWTAAEATCAGDQVTLRGTRVTFDPARHQGIREVKAVTYHQLAVGRDASGWHADVVFDV